MSVKHHMHVQNDNYTYRVEYVCAMGIIYMILNAYFKDLFFV